MRGEEGVAGSMVGERLSIWLLGLDDEYVYYSTCFCICLKTTLISLLLSYPK